VNEARLREVLGAPELRWIVAKARRRLEQGAPARGVVRKGAPSAAERHAFERLFGKVTRGASLAAPLDELSRVLREAEVCDDLEQAIVALTGPIRDERAEARAAWEAVFAEAAAQHDGRPEVAMWLADLKATGLVRRLCGGDPAAARPLLREALDAARRLPADGVPIATLAASVTGDSHTLDAGEPLGTLVVRLAAALGGVARWERPAERREAWDSVGVLPDTLSAPVLVLDLPADPANLTGRALAMHAEAGEPCRLSVRQLLRSPPRFDLAGREVFVCENPAIVAAAADRLGARSAPLVCVEGQPRTAARLLLAALQAAGAALRYHGDFDWGGLRIGNVIARRHGATPWRYGTADYVRARKGAPLCGAPVEASWDADLAAAMREHGRAAHEEGVVDPLLEDLARGEGTGTSGPVDARGGREAPSSSVAAAASESKLIL
jgi:uncharacterized protein (TIGR02679 family)